ncbi:MAG: hypothetical protein R2713_01000 [Ilumatobacteraceae bacterium]
MVGTVCRSSRSPSRRSSNEELRRTSVAGARTPPRNHAPLHDARRAPVRPDRGERRDARSRTGRTVRSPSSSSRRRVPRQLVAERHQHRRPEVLPWHPRHPGRETSLRQVIDRVADTITTWGVEGGYFVDTDEADAFRND